MASTTSNSSTSKVRIAHIDCSSGLSGDKFLGALLDVGTQTGAFTAANLAELAATLTPEAQVLVSTTSSYDIKATAVTVTTVIEGATPDAQAAARSWTDISASIKAVPTDLLSVPARENALQVFTKLAQVEAQIHQTAVEDVHFHELGAADSIIDIVGSCAALDALNIRQLYATPPALGSGSVKTQHGIVPVPAPATAALLLGIPTTMSSATGELTTPTGAALLQLVDGFGAVPPLTACAVGYGAGTRDIGQPNICRLLLGVADAETLPNTIAAQDTVLLETNIDHIAPEAVAFAGEQLLAEGALDVWVIPIAMKKSRAALTFCVLTTPQQAEHFAARMMKLTGTLGVRVSLQPRYVSDRDSVTIDTPWGSVQVKVANGRARPEHEDIARIAREHNLDYPFVLKEVTAAAMQQITA